jgi:hypothetical protein
MSLFAFQALTVVLQAQLVFSLVLQPHRYQQNSHLSF